MPRQAELSTEGSRLRVAAGILWQHGAQVLIADRARHDSLAGYWEFPGGKIADGETALAALSRELEEELGIRTIAAEHLCTLAHDYPALRVAIEFFLVRAWDGDPAALEGQSLRWVPVTELDRCNLLPADEPVVGALQRLATSCSEVSKY